MEMSDGPDQQRGIQYAESLDYGKVCHPDPEKIKRFHEEWEGITGYWKDEDD